MQKKTAVAIAASTLIVGVVLILLAPFNQPQEAAKYEKEGYDGPMERGLFEVLRTQDPALGFVPVERLWPATVRTELEKEIVLLTRRSGTVFWEERGPIYDSVGRSNGNGRGAPASVAQLPGTYTSGRIRAVLVDAADPSGNTVWTGGVAGGLWKTTNFLSTEPAWQIVSDYFDNMAISSIAQDPTNSDIMYFSTGEATSNSDAVLGRGVWKTTDHGLTWTHLPSTTSYTRNFKILCDKDGNVYLATRASGLRRSKDGGATWTSISPSPLTGVTSSTYCTDIEFAGDRLLASFGYTTSSSGGTIAIRYTDIPATTTSTGWTTPTGLPTDANRIELAARGDTVYAAPTTSTNNVLALYRSFDQGSTWVKTNPVNFGATSIANGQGWYNLALEINPVNGLEVMVGGLDAYRSNDGGTTVVRNTFWNNNPPYVHADHHTYKWMFVDGQLRIIMATDGGLFLSLNNGLTYRDKNKGLVIKQFYSCALHPTQPYYLLAGSQDNGSHQIKTPGRTYSIEVTGGDGAYVDIDQLNPNFQFTSYVYSQYRRSTNEGNNFSSFNFSSSRGYFINPFDYDDEQKIIYASYAVSSAPNKKLLRWNNPTTATSTTNASRDSLIITALAKGSSASNVSSVAVSPYTPNRVYVGGHNGSLVRIDSANIATNADINTKTKTLTGSSFPSAFLNCIAIGNSDDELLAVFSNYGVSNLWYSINGGTNWTAIDGNLPDIPVRWAVFHPTEPNKLLIATETGVWGTEMINGSSTFWEPSGNFPTVRTDMLKVRKSDNTILAATHGRGLWATTITSVLPVKEIVLSGSMQNDGYTLLAWKSYGETAATKFRIEYSNDGSRYQPIGTVSHLTKNFMYRQADPLGFYRITSVESNTRSVYSNIISIRGSGKPAVQVFVAPNPVVAGANFILSTDKAGQYNWQIIEASGKIVQSGKGNAQAGRTNVPMNVSALARGVYRLRVILDGKVASAPFVKQ